MTAQDVFLAGASGAIGKRLVPQLIEAGHKVFGTTRSPEKAAALRELGATPVVVDVFDHTKLAQAFREVRPSIVINQLTDLPKKFSGSLPGKILKANARLREEGTRNLAAAAIAVGVRRFISQSLGWIYSPGPEPHSENDPLDRNPNGPAARSIAGVMALERITLGSPPLEGVILRYGQFYGPGTWNTAQNGPLPVHIDAAAHAALLAIETKHAGIFNIAEENGLISCEKARRELGWRADFRLESAIA